MGKKMISLRFNESLLEYLKKREDVKIDGLTAYLEKRAAKHSKFIDQLKAKK